tara:strand:+ start:470 stop:622 length:153 start_codon:yes stop_codon:yes gene_type:complete
VNLDTLQTTAIGTTSAAVIGLDVLPIILSCIIGVMTIVHLVIKIKKELGK